jgi:hypothetical protein
LADCLSAKCPGVVFYQLDVVVVELPLLSDDGSLEDGAGS